jgi:serine/threonine protein kinase
MKIWNEKWINSDNKYKQGGQGRVYFVTNFTDKEKIYALKEIKPRVKPDRFKAEIDFVKMIPKHENIISLIDSGYCTKSRSYYFVMNKIDKTLPDYIVYLSNNLKELFHFFMEILGGINHIHNLGIIHRDLKPQNILVENGKPIISDFGISFDLNDSERLTRINEVVGPRYYAAPEFEDGKYNEIQKQADYYSLGKILYYILSNGNIFSREKFRETKFDLCKIRSDERFRYFNDEIFNYSICSRISQRFKSMDRFIEAVDNAFENYFSHPLSTIEEKISLNTINESPALILDHNFSEKEVHSIIRYFSKYKNTIPANVLISLLHLQNERHSSLPEILINSMDTYSEDDKVFILNEIGKTKDSSRMFFNTISHDKLIKLLVLPLIDSINPKSRDNIINSCYLYLRNSHEAVIIAMKYIQTYSNETKTLTIKALQDSLESDGFHIFEELYSSYNPQNDNNELTVFEVIITGLFKYLPLNKINQYFYPNAINPSKAKLGCIGRALVSANKYNRKFIEKIDRNKINDGVVLKILEVCDGVNTDSITSK